MKAIRIPNEIDNCSQLELVMILNDVVKAQSPFGSHFRMPELFYQFFNFGSLKGCTR